MYHQVRDVDSKRGYACVCIYITHNMYSVDAIINQTKPSIEVLRGGGEHILGLFQISLFQIHFCNLNKAYIS